MIFSKALFFADTHHRSSGWRRAAIFCLQSVITKNEWRDLGA
jgi:hypothetical protein